MPPPYLAVSYPPYPSYLLPTNWVSRELPDVAEVEVRVGAGQLTQPDHQLVRLGQVVVKSYSPVSTVQIPHQAEVLFDSLKIFLRLVFTGGSVPVEREAGSYLGN